MVSYAGGTVDSLKSSRIRTLDVRKLASEAVGRALARVVSSSKHTVQHGATGHTAAHRTSRLIYPVQNTVAVQTNECARRSYSYLNQFICCLISAHRNTQAVA